MAEDKGDEKQSGEESGMETELVFPGEGDSLEFGAVDSQFSHGDAAHDGLETDDRQAAEIREIFGTAFPQYLLPVEEIFDQLLAGNGDEESLEAIEGMLSSLIAASLRMGFGNVKEKLALLREQVAFFDSISGASIPDEQKQKVRGLIEDLKALAREMGGQTDDAAPQQSPVAALKNTDGIGQIALKRLSAAGFVTVEQMLIGKPDEIAAVSGLDMAIVQTILAHLRAGAAAPASFAEPSPAASAVPLRSVPAVPDSEPQPSSSQWIDTLHEQMLEMLRKEVEAEAEALRAAVRNRRSQIQELRTELHVTEFRIKEMERTLSDSAQSVAKIAAVLEDFSVRRQVLAGRFAAAAESARRMEVALEARQREQAALVDQASNLSTAVGGLVSELGRLRRSAARGSS